MGRFRRWVERAAAYGSRFRSPASARAFDAIVSRIGPSTICLSVGGGPTVIQPGLVNLNIEIGPAIDLTGDAHQTPLKDSSIDAIYSEAVLEHLERPGDAVREMFRIAKPGAPVLTVIPFIQVFHGYPSHYQNFTLHGHRELIRHGGFEILDSGTCVGPTFALLDLASNYLREYLPGKLLSRSGYYGLRILFGPLCVVDRFLVTKPASHVVASTTFVWSRKPIG